MGFFDLYKISYNNISSVIVDFCNDVDLFLSPHQMSKYINDLLMKVNENVEDNNIRNKEYYEEYIKQDFTILENELKVREELNNTVLLNPMFSFTNNAIRFKFMIKFIK